MKKKLLTKRVIVVLSFLFSFLILDIGIRFLLYKEIDFLSYKSLSPLLFSLRYILIIISLLLIFYKKIKIFYIILSIMANTYFLAQMIHFKILGKFFSVVSLFSVGEGADYFDYVIKSIDGKMIIIVLLSMISVITVFIILKNDHENKIINFEHNKIVAIVMLCLAIFFRFAARNRLGNPISNNAWDAWKNPKNVYINFNNNNRSFMVSGMYEYIFRDIYLYTKQKMNPNNIENIEEINKYIESLNIKQEENKYTNIFKDKNLIMIMLESIDDWLVTEEVMPTLKKIEEEGINFENRYAPFYGAAMTINSEFASVSGLYSVTSEKAIYNYNNNNFDYSLPSLFKKNGYAVNSIHMNNGEFYNRKNFHIGLGFDNHYALSDMNLKSDFEYDSNIALDNDSYNLIVSDKKFMTLITTYSAHIPYKGNRLCNKLITENSNLIENNNEELTCLKLLANETDNFIKILLERLKKDGYLDDTIIVIYADHYSYGYTKINDVKKTNDNNLIQKTPLVIWGKGIEHQNIKTLIDTADIPVTLFNMFGIGYNPKLYMGTDVFSSYHENFVYFSDYSWFDGNYYSIEGIENEYTKNISKIVNEKNNINGKIILSDYYRYYKE